MNKILFALLLIVSFPLSIYPQRYWNMNEVASINCPDVKFGYAMANGDVNGDGFSDLIVGSYTSLNLDKVYIWLGGAPFDTIIDITLTGTHPFGLAIACGDVNNDGYDDILVGRDAFEARLYYGGNSMDTTADWIVHRPSSSLFSCFGHWVAISDLNGDNYGDIIIGDPRQGEQSSNIPGAVYIYYGSDNPDTLYDWIAHGENDSNFGWKLSSDYDVNGDGITDLAVGAPSAPAFFPSISIFYGGEGSNFDTICDVEISNPCGELEYGSSCPLIKDINSDGYDDLAAGACYHNQVYIYFGGNPMDNQYDVVLSGDTMGFGMSVVGIDNADGDIYGDILIGNPHYGDTLENGMVYLFRGGNPFDSFPDAYAMGENNKEIGWSVGYAGDLNNDGKDEMVFSNYVVGSPTIWITNYIETGVEEERRHKTREIRLFVHPNPFTTTTAISLIFPSAKEHKSTRAQGIKLNIYDVAGRKIRELNPKKIVNSQFTTLNYTWDGKNVSGKKVSTGIYFIKGKIGSSQINEKVVFVR